MERPAPRSTERAGEGRCVLAGRYSIDEYIGEGAMGVVFGGRDLVSGAPIAVKRLHTRFYDDPRKRLGMAHEVHAMARLRHPGVVRVLDFGYERGAPYLVMERVLGRPLSAYVGQGLPWPALRALGISVLRTLAHAHARGVVHLDLKPANILVVDATSAKIVDFGIARLSRAGDAASMALEARVAAVDDAARVVRGSRVYMAPEQAMGDETRIGPSSDLFAVGVILFLTASGRLPFPHRAVGDPATWARDVEPLPFQPRMSVPGALATLIGDLLRPDALDRGEFAADYARRLEALPASSSASLPELGPPPAPQPLSADFTEVFVLPTGAWEVPEEPVRRAATEPSSPSPGEEPTVLCTEMTSIGDTPRWGTGLFGIREPDLVGRSQQQGALLEPAAQVLSTTGRTTVRIVRGAPGVGKSRLARWLAQRSREDGSFQVLSAFYGRGGTEGGVRGALREWLRVRGASMDLVAQIAARRLDCGEVAATALASALAPWESGAGHKAAREVERALVVALASMARARPVLLWIDDVGSSIGAAGYRWLKALLAEDALSPMRIYVVATQSTDIPAAAAALAEELATDPRVRVIECDPLDDEAMLAIVDDLLPLEPRLARAIAGKAAGNPLYLLYVLAHLVETDRLESHQGLLSLPGERPESMLPATLAEAIEARLAGIAIAGGGGSAPSNPPGRAAAALAILERLALLGRRVELRLLRRALELEPRPDLAAVLPEVLDLWLDAGVLSTHEHGVLSIEQRPLANALIERARRAGSWAEGHRAAALAKEEELAAAGGDPALMAEIASHLASAGSFEVAAERAIDAGWRSVTRGHAQRGLECFELAERCVAELDEARARPLRARLYTFLAPTEFRAGRADRARDAATAAVMAARPLGDPELLAMALIAEGDVLRRAGASDIAVERLLEAIELARTHDLPTPLGRASYSLAHIGYMRGDLALADRLCLDAVEAGRRVEEPWTALWASALRRAIALAQRDFDGALARIDHDRQEALACGFATLVSQIDGHLGEVALARAQPREALQHLERHRDVIDLVGDPSLQAYTRLYLAVALAQLGRAAEAEAHATDALRYSDLSNAAETRRASFVLLAYATALQRRWDETRTYLAELGDDPEELYSMEREIARVLTKLGRLAVDSDHRDLGKRALSRASVHLRRLGADSELAAIEATLTAVGEAS